MAPSYLSFLALASSAAAVPYFGHGHQRHQRLHHTPAGYAADSGSVVAPVGTDAPYLPANGSSIVGPTGGSTGTGATGIATSYETAYETAYATLTSYMSQIVEPSSASSSDVPVDAAETSASSCTSSDVTVTSKVKTTVYITPSGYAASSDVVAPVSSAASENIPAYTPIEESSASVTASFEEAAPVESTQAPPAYDVPAASSSSEVAPVESSQAPPAYSEPAASSTEVAPIGPSSAPVEVPAAYSSVETSTAAAETPAPYTSEAATTSTSVEVAPVEETTTSAMIESSAPAAYSFTTTSSAPAEATSAPSYSGGNLSNKRGLSYNDASLLQCLADAGDMGWAYNWASVTDDIPAGVQFIPTLWSTSSEFTEPWAENAQAAIDSGSAYLFSFNEPDLSEQANMAVAESVAGYKEHMMPFAGKAQLGSPSVTNGGGEMGLTYLSNFLQECDGCQVDFVNVHWYDSYQNVEYFKTHVQNATDVAGGKPVFVSEFGCNDGGDEEVSGFLEEVLPWMHEQEFVVGYSYFMAREGVMVSGDEPNAVGQTYATAV